MTRILKAMFLVSALIVVSGCVTIETIKSAGIALPLEEIQTIKVSSITVTKRDIETDTEIVSILKSRLKEVMPMCATGDQPYDMTVRIDNFKEQNGGATILVGDTIGLDGLIEFRKQGSNELAGEYYGSPFRAGGGLLGALGLSGAHQQLSKRFALDLCEQFFKRPVPEDYDRKPEPEDPSSL